MVFAVGIAWQLKPDAHQPYLQPLNWNDAEIRRTASDGSLWASMTAQADNHAGAKGFQHERIAPVIPEEFRHLEYVEPGAGKAEIYPRHDARDVPRAAGRAQRGRQRTL